MCYALPILKTEEEFLALDDEPSVNVVTDVPDNFKQWVRDNSDRIISASEKSTLPYFLKDNSDSWDKVLFPERYAEGTNKINSENTNIVTKPHYGSAMKLGRSATKEAMKVVENIGALVLTDAQKKNMQELANALGIPYKDIKPMTFLDADHGISNPTKDKNNCQSVIVSFVARRRGLDCVALPFSKQNLSQVELMEKFQNAFLVKDKKGNYRPINPTVITGKTDEEIIAKARKQLSADGEYILGINYIKEPWEKEAQGHVANLVKKGNQIFINDEQISDILKLESYSKIYSFEIIKIDNLILDINKVKDILTLR